MGPLPFSLFCPRLTSLMVLNAISILPTLIYIWNHTSPLYTVYHYLPDFFIWLSQGQGHVKLNSWSSPENLFLFPSSSSQWMTWLHITRSLGGILDSSHPQTTTPSPFNSKYLSNLSTSLHLTVTFTLVTFTIISDCSRLLILSISNSIHSSPSNLFKH